jgi:hypothetical protein
MAFGCFCLILSFMDNKHFDFSPLSFGRISSFYEGFLYIFARYKAFFGEIIQKLNEKFKRDQIIFQELSSSRVFSLITIF